MYCHRQTQTSLSNTEDEAYSKHSRKRQQELEDSESTHKGLYVGACELGWVVTASMACGHSCDTSVSSQVGALQSGESMNAGKCACSALCGTKQTAVSTTLLAS
jgi:hypothetical protein